MDEDLLFNTGGPALSLLAATPSQVCDLMLAWIPAHREWDIFRVRGEKSRDKATFLDELSAVLQFPYYFGFNWDAAWECITDLYWLKGASFLLIFDSAQHLLSASDDDFQVLLRSLADAHDAWHAVQSDFGEHGKQPTAFQSVLACAPEAVEELAQRLGDANATFTRL
jgi:RNAse (barnase) inhibitor barstar